MSPERAWPERVRHMLDAIAKVVAYIDGVSEAEFRADVRTVDAVSYNVFVLGEAANGIPAEVRDRFPSVPWTQIRGMRNVLAHQYFEASVQVLWDTAKNDLPALVESLRRMLEGQ